MAFCYTYVLRSKKDGSLYIGFTTNLQKRYAQHNAGQSLATRHKIPYELIYYEAFRSKKDAKAREIYLKSGWGFQTIKKLLKHFLSS